MIDRKRRFRQLPGGTRPHIDGPGTPPPPMLTHWVAGRLDPFHARVREKPWRGVPRVPLGGSEHGRVIETVPGEYSWTCPEDVLAVMVYATGPGGNGAGAWTGGSGGGGGGGGLGMGPVAVTPGTTYNYTVGAPGTDSSFTGDTGTITGGAGSDALLAAGGARGGPNGGMGGNGFAGGASGGGGGGGSGGASGGGGAGGSASSSAGGAGGTAGAGVPVPGAAGGAGGHNVQNGFAGSAPGAGGGGGGANGASVGGAGANGQVWFTW